MKSFLLVIAFVLACASASCVNQVCRCRSDAVEVRVPDGLGCTTCFCAASAAAVSTAAATTAAPTTAAARATTAAATTARATTAAATSPAPTTARCGALPTCDCPSGATISWATDARGCPSQCSCSSAPSTARASTAAATTLAPATTAKAQCPVVTTCTCFRNEETPTWVTDGNGCRACTCLAPPATTARATTAAPTTTAAPVCAPLALRDNCNCAPTTTKIYRTDAWGCLVCGCQASTTIATTARPTTRAATTAARATAAPTTAAPTTAAPRASTAAATSARPATTYGDVCPEVYMCRCQASAKIVWQSDSTGCPVCFCQASGTSFEAIAVSSDDTALPTFVPAIAVVMCALAVSIGIVLARKHFATAEAAVPLLP